MFCWPQGFYRTTKIFHFEDKGSSKYMEETHNSHFKARQNHLVGRLRDGPGAGWVEID